MNAQEAWDMGQDGYDPHWDHIHCEMCGACETETELVAEREVGMMSTTECLPCHAKGIAEDCGEAVAA